MTDGARECGIVVIGRNEGERLVRCLKSVAGAAAPVVYVDSGSTDRSVEHARRWGALVVELDPEVSFTAARARNAGLDRLIDVEPNLSFVQFVDGDCEIDPEWLGIARRELLEDDRLAVVCGRRRERYPERTVYNRLCDLEWDTPIGDAASCGGDSMMRVSALREVGGFEDGIIAGEEPELCHRLRRAGYGVRRLDAEMTLHDADIHRFSQWWKRSVRGGHAAAEAMARHGSEPGRPGVRRSLRIWGWGLLLPAAVAATAWPTGGWSLLALLLYPLLALKTAAGIRRGRGWPVRHALLYGAFCTLAKFPELQGQIAYRLVTRRRGFGRIIEYKGARGEA